MDIKFKEVTKADMAARFWCSMAAALSVGAHCAQQLGLVDFDVAKLNRYLVQQIKDAQKDAQAVLVTSAPESVVEVVARYMEQFSKHFVGCRLLPGQGVVDPGWKFPDNEPKNVQAPVRGLICDSGEIMLAKGVFQQWLAHNKFGGRDVMGTILATHGATDGSRVQLQRALPDAPGIRPRYITFFKDELEQLA